VQNNINAIFDNLLKQNEMLV